MSPIETSRDTRPAVIVVVGAALLVLAAASFATSYAPLGRAALPVALAIAAMKGALVVWIFMELRRERASTRLAAIAAVLMVATMVGFTATDVATRGVSPIAEPQGR